MKTDIIGEAAKIIEDNPVSLDEEFLLESNESNFWVSLIGLSFNAADLTRFIVGIKPAKIKTNLPASKNSLNDGRLWKRKKDNIIKIKIIK